MHSAHHVCTVMTVISCSVSCMTVHIMYVYLCHKHITTCVSLCHSAYHVCTVAQDTLSCMHCDHSAYHDMHCATSTLHDILCHSAYHVVYLVPQCIHNMICVSSMTVHIMYVLVAQDTLMYALCHKIHYMYALCITDALHDMYCGTRYTS